MNARLAVYGSLKAGGKLHGIMQEGGAKFLGQSTFQGELYSLGPYPAAVLSANADSKVHCEVYECPDALVQRLDRVEGHPWVYMRTAVETEHFGKVEVYIYQRRPPADRRIPSGNYDVRDWR